MLCKLKQGQSLVDIVPPPPPFLFMGGSACLDWNTFLAKCCRKWKFYNYRKKKWNPWSSWILCERKFFIWKAAKLQSKAAQLSCENFSWLIHPGGPVVASQVDGKFYDGERGCPPLERLLDWAASAGLKKVQVTPSAVLFFFVIRTAVCRDWRLKRQILSNLFRDIVRQCMIPCEYYMECLASLHV